MGLNIDIIEIMDECGWDGGEEERGREVVEREKGMRIGDKKRRDVITIED